MSAEIPIETLNPVVAPTPVHLVTVGPYTLDTIGCTVRFEGEPPVALTQFEMTLLGHLAAQPGTLISKEELVRLMYNGRCRPISNGLEVFVGRIRRKIDPEGTRRPLQTVRFSGYRFRNDWGTT